jgi:predicted ArsR family transcriptional regulator
VIKQEVEYDGLRQDRRDHRLWQDRDARWEASRAKSRGPLATSALARVLGIAVVGIRQHLSKLHAEGLVAL